VDEFLASAEETGGSTWLARRQPRKDGSVSARSSPLTPEEEQRMVIVYIRRKIGYSGR
jgi:hypothetical protein